MPVPTSYIIYGVVEDPFFENVRVLEEVLLIKLTPDNIRFDDY